MSWILKSYLTFTLMSHSPPMHERGSQVCLDMSELYVSKCCFLGAESLCAWHIINSCWLNEYFKNWLSFSILTGQNHESQIGNRNCFFKKIFTFMNLLWVLHFCAYSCDHEIYSIVYIIHDGVQDRFLNLLHIMHIHYKMSQ